MSYIKQFLIAGPALRFSKGMLEVTVGKTDPYVSHLKYGNLAIRFSNIDMDVDTRRLFKVALCVLCTFGT